MFRETLSETTKREDFLKIFKRDEESTLKELKRFKDLIKGIEKETYFKFKTRLNARRNKSLVVTSGSLYVKLDVLVDTTAGRTTSTVTALDKEGYEMNFNTIQSADIKTPKELALLLGIDEDNYNDSARVKAY